MEGNYANYSVTVTARQGRFRLTGLQRELDQTWAVLGEVYGLQVHTGLNLLGLRIRRVKSNIDDVAEFAKTVPYVPDQIAFEAANADLLKLLVAPLYGDNPGIGLRELFQNSVDAVREFNDLASRNSAVLLVDRYEQDADVTLKIDCDEIVIETERPSHDSLREFIATPNISVFDKDGKLPVNLQRTGLRGPLPFVDDLLRSIAEDLLAYALIEAPDTCEVPWFDGTYEGFFTTPYQQSIYQSDWDRWLVGREGFVLNTPPLAKMCQPKRIVTIIGGGPHRQIWGEALRRALPNDTLFVSQLHDVFSDDNPKIKGVFQSAIWGRRFDHFTLTDHRTYIPQILIDKIKTLRPGRQVANDLALIEEAPRKGDWSIAGIGESAPWLEGILSSLPFENTSMILSIGGVDFSEHSGALQPLADRWMEVAATPIVPFEIQKRKALVKLAERTIGPLL
jgi:hypothetical protein